MEIIKALIIDPQNDFVDDQHGSLKVAGAVADMQRLVNLFERAGRRFKDVIVTLDTHRVMDVAHPFFWQDKAGNPPQPFTIITVQDLLDGVWEPRAPELRARVLAYVQALEQGGKYPLMVWPEHCVLGTWGHNLYPPLAEVLMAWERRMVAHVDYHLKGLHYLTEHYGALKAEVPDPNDPTTQLNSAILRQLQEADKVLIAGEASSHCVKATVEQVVEHIGEQHLPKLFLLTDCMSPVAHNPGGPDFPAEATAFLQQMEQRGLKLVKSTDLFV